MPEKTDVFCYNGPISRGKDLEFMEYISEHKRHDHISLVLATGGGDPDAAYKIGRYLQDCYDYFSLIVAGFCKSAGSLIAIGANELVFTP